MSQIKSVASIQVTPQDARRLYYQGKDIVVSSDGYTTQIKANQLSSPVEEVFFKQPILYFVLLTNEESLVLKSYQKSVLKKMIFALGSVVISINIYLATQIVKAAYPSILMYYIVIAGLLYIACANFINMYELSKNENNEYLKLLEKYRINPNED